MIGAYFYFLRCSLKNRLVARVRRLKQPKYALALIVGLGYFFFIFGFNILRTGLTRPQANAPPGFSEEWFDWGAIVLGIIYVIFIWVFKAAGPGLFFRPSEIHYLFTAPVTRRQIIHYHILRAQPGILFTTLIIGLFAFMRMSTRRPLYPMMAWFVILNIISLHSTAASLVRASVFQHGKAGVRRYGRELFILVLVLGIVAFQSSTFSLSRLVASGAVEDFCRRVFDAPVAYVVFYPLRALGRLLFSRDLGTFLRYLGPAVALLALHYMWVIRTDVAFEEASQERSRQIAERIERWRKGKPLSMPRRGRRLRQPFRLSAAGPVSTAIFWKNLTSKVRLPAVPTVASLALVGLVASVTLGLSGWGKEICAIPAFGIAVGVAFVFFVAGPGLFRNDLRQDLSRLDILKALPVSGVQMILGQILAPLAILCSIQMLLCPFGIFFLVMSGAFSVGVGVALLATIVFLYPAYAMLGLLVHNAMVLYFPDWASGFSDQKRGIESMGMRIVYFVIMLAAVGLLLLPAILAAGIGVMLGLLIVGREAWTAVMVVMAMAAGAILAAECFFFIKFLGKKYESFDFATECTSRDVL
jgi:hypothetical protein